MSAKPTTIDAQEVWEKLLRRDPMFILDVRNRDEFERWRVEGPQVIQTLNIPYFELADLESDDEDVTQAVMRGLDTQGIVQRLPRDLPILAVCAEGNTSSHVAAALRHMDFYAVNLEGGMEAWGNYYSTRPVVENERFSLFQIARPARGCLSHVLVSDRHAVVFDPGRHLGPYRDLALRLDAQIEGAFDTHLHADHLSGGPALSQQEHVSYHLHPYDAIHPVDLLPARVPFRWLEEGETFLVGQAEVRVLHVPGHTLGMVAFLVEGRYLLSGDSLFVESIARPDLGGKAEGWTPLLYDSLRRMIEMPGDTVVLPGHFNDMAAISPDGVFRASVRELKASNPGVLKLGEGLDAFTRYILENLPTFPDAYIEIKRANAGLSEPDEREALELELGKNICAIGRA